MIKSKIFTLLMSLFFSTLLLAKDKMDYKIVSMGNDFYMKKIASKPILIKLNVTGSETKLVRKFKKKNTPNLVYIVYDAGDSGTSAIVKEYRAAIFHTKKKRFVSDVPFRYELQGAKNTLVQPIWKVEKRNLIIMDGGIEISRVAF